MRAQGPPLATSWPHCASRGAIRRQRMRTRPGGSPYPARGCNRTLADAKRGRQLENRWAQARTGSSPVPSVRPDSSVVGLLGPAGPRYEETVIAPVLQPAPLLAYVAEPRGRDEQLRLEARAELPVDDLDAVRRRAEELAELDTEREAVGLVQIGHKDGVVVEGRRRAHGSLAVRG